MKRRLGVICILASGTVYQDRVTCLEALPPREQLKVVQANVVFRHGARTPLQPMGSPHHHDFHVRWDECHEHKYHELFAPVKICGVDGHPPPNVWKSRSSRSIDTDVTSIVGNCKPGQLTVLGALQTYELGYTLRKEYVEKHALISARYDPQQVRVRSTFMTRAVQSAQGVLRGLFDDDSTGQCVAEVFVHQPEHETLIPHEKTCDKLRLLFKRAKQRFNQHPDEEEVRKMMANRMEHDLDVRHIKLRDSLVARMTHGIPLPEGWDHELSNKVARLAEWQLEELFVAETENQRETVRLAIGRQIREFLENMREKITAMSDAKSMYLYSAHDTTLVPILVALRVFDGKWPPFAAYVAIELLENQQNRGSFFVRVVYNGEEQLLEDFASFERRVCDVIPADFQKECTLDEALKMTEQLPADKASTGTSF
ncbi:Lysophosphatidic acid phosphatase type 6 [Porphyridium purpureum]|uniref:Lysophosphatidic acid phosphatase type 6 n=1 Tax=Porphyridium purpureum TaxID=35688 RepID=A0A5J4Z3E9_PORPP|nr:Lysophosphatidic acid phosphatase type 6 [Porphyridium purpureum]|eukprot:POR7495..scf295_1